MADIQDAVNQAVAAAMAAQAAAAAPAGGGAIAHPPAVVTALPEDVNRAFGISNGTFTLVPESATAGHVATGGELVFVAGAAPGVTLGQARRYNPIMQFTHSRRCGMGLTKAALMAGARGGLLNARTVMGWALCGNKMTDVKSVMSRTQLSNTISGGEAARVGLTAVVPASEDEWDALYDTPQTVHSKERLSYASFLVGNCISLALREDEVMEMPADTSLSSAEQEEVLMADAKSAMRQGAESAMNLCFLIAMHKQRTGGHHWISNKSQNNCKDAFDAMYAACKLTVEAGEVFEVMHDLLHPFADLQLLVHTAMQRTDLQGVFCEAVAYRYPFQMVGMAALTSLFPYFQYVEDYLGMRKGGKVTIFGGANPQWAMIEKIKAPMETINADMVAHPEKYAAGMHAYRKKRDALLVNVKKVSAFMRAVVLALNPPSGSTFLASPAIKATTKLYPAMADAGTALGRKMAALSMKDVTSLEAVGMDVVLQGLVPIV